MTSADLILENASARTLDARSPSASSVALRGGPIVAVGDRAETSEWRGAATDVIDLGGAALLPGLVDSHLHPFLGTEQARGADLTGLRTLDRLDALRSERLRCGDGEWVHGYALAYEAFESAGIRAETIDDAVQGSPALLHFFASTRLSRARARSPSRGSSVRGRSARKPRSFASAAFRPVSCASWLRSRS